MSYVGYATVGSEAALHDLIQRFDPSETYYFLRSLHQVSGIQRGLPAALSPEGQIFNASTELRWKTKGQGYDLLWLGQASPDAAMGFMPIKRNWQTDDRPVLLHQRKTPQYPHLFRYPKGLEKRLQQRYFRDANTDIVHFIALTVPPNQATATTKEE